MLTTITKQSILTAILVALVTILFLTYLLTGESLRSGQNIDRTVPGEISLSEQQPVRHKPHQHHSHPAHTELASSPVPPGVDVVRADEYTEPEVVEVKVHLTSANLHHLRYFILSLKQGLALGYVKAQYLHTHHRHRRDADTQNSSESTASAVSNQTDNNISIKIIDIVRTSNDTIEVIFQVTDNGVVVNSSLAVETYRELTVEELSDFIHAQVIGSVEAVPTQSSSSLLPSRTIPSDIATITSTDYTTDYISPSYTITPSLASPNTSSILVQPSSQSFESDASTTSSSIDANQTISVATQTLASTTVNTTIATTTPTSAIVTTPLSTTTTTAIPTKIPTSSAYSTDYFTLTSVSFLYSESSQSFSPWDNSSLFSDSATTTPSLYITQGSSNISDTVSYTLPSVDTSATISPIVTSLIMQTSSSFNFSESISIPTMTLLSSYSTSTSIPFNVNTSAYSLSDLSTKSVITSMYPSISFYSTTSLDTLTTQLTSTIATSLQTTQIISIPTETPSLTQSSQPFPTLQTSQSSFQTISTSPIPYNQTSLLTTLNPSTATFYANMTSQISTTIADTNSSLMSYMTTDTSLISPSLSSSSMISESSSIVTTTTTTQKPATSVPRLLKIKIKIPSDVDIHSQSFRQRLKEALLKIYLEGKKRKQKNRVKRAVGEDNENSGPESGTEVKITQVSEEDGLAIVKFHVAVNDSAEDAGQSLLVFHQLTLSEMEQILGFQ